MRTARARVQCAVRPRWRRGARGFTLVEVLVALAAAALIAAMSWQGIDGMVRAEHATAHHTDGVLRLQAGLAQWQADLNAMVVWPATQTEPVGLDWNGRVLRITRDADAGADVRVAAWARRGSDGSWLRWQSAPLVTRAAWRAAWASAAQWAASSSVPAGAFAGGQAVAIAQTLDWSVYYFRGNAWVNPLSSPQTQAATPPGANAAPANAPARPDAVRLLITLAPAEPLQGALTLDWIRPDYSGVTP